MAIQKISALTSVNQLKSTPKSQGKCEQVSSNVSETSPSGSKAIRNNFMSGISFKGYTTKAHAYSSPTYIPPDPYGTSGRMGGYIGEAKVTPSNIANPEYTRIIAGKKGHDVETPSYASGSVYFADPGEEITEKIKKDHMYIVVYDEKPDPITTEDINSEKKSSKLSSYVDDLDKSVAISQALYDAKERQVEAKREELKSLEEEMASAQTELEAEKDKLQLAQTRLDIVRKEERAAYRDQQISAKKAEMAKLQQELDKLMGEDD